MTDRNNRALVRRRRSDLEELDQEELEPLSAIHARSRSSATWSLSSGIIHNLSDEETERAALSVMCALHLRMVDDEDAEIIGLLPPKLQALLKRCPPHEALVSARFGREEFFQRIARDLDRPPQELEPIVRGVFSSLREQITEEEAEDMSQLMPDDLQELWRRLS